MVHKTRLLSLEKRRSSRQGKTITAAADCIPIAADSPGVPQEMIEAVNAAKQVMHDWLAVNPDFADRPSHVANQAMRRDISVQDLVEETDKAVRDALYAWWTV